MAVPGSIKMLCPNPECINKSIVYRKPSSSDFTCKRCKTTLITFICERDNKRLERAKREVADLMTDNG